MHFSRYLVLLSSWILYAHGCTPQSMPLIWQNTPGNTGPTKGKVDYMCNKISQRSLGMLGFEDGDSTDMLLPRVYKGKEPAYCHGETSGKKSVQSTTVDVHVDGNEVSVTTPMGHQIDVQADTVRMTGPNGRTHSAITIIGQNRGNCPARMEFRTPLTWWNARRGDPAQGPGAYDLPENGDNCEINNIAPTTTVISVVIMLLGYYC